jgi:predicted nucleic acid-binding protein
VVVTAPSWLIDKSALARLPLSLDAAEWVLRVERGLVYVSTPTLLEVGFSARSSAEWVHRTEGPPLMMMPVTNLTPAAEHRAVHVQGLLAQRGMHRAPSVPDLLIAAIAETSALTVLHVDKDFELIAEVTGQPMERLRMVGDPK